MIRGSVSTGLGTIPQIHASSRVYEKPESFSSFKMTVDSTQDPTESGDITDVRPHPHASVLAPISSEPEPSDTTGSEETLRIEQQPAAEPSIHTRSTTDDADVRSRTQRPALSTRDSRSTIVLEGWVDDEYCSENPWYGQARKKPVFSLARPLPHTLRRAARLSKGDIENQEEAVNGSRADLVSTHSRVAPEGLSRNVSNSTEQRMTAAGVTHSGKRNDGGQPVFTYLPGEIACGDDKYSTIERCELGTTDHGPHYGIDSEPLGKRDNNSVESRKDPDELRNWWARIRARHPEPLAEFLAVSSSLLIAHCSTHLLIGRLMCPVDRRSHLPGPVCHPIRQPHRRTRGPVRDVRDHLLGMGLCVDVRHLPRRRHFGSAYEPRDIDQSIHLPRLPVALVPHIRRAAISSGHHGGWPCVGRVQGHDSIRGSHPREDIPMFLFNPAGTGLSRQRVPQPVRRGCRHGHHRLCLGRRSEQSSGGWDACICKSLQASDPLCFTPLMLP